MKKRILISAPYMHREKEKIETMLKDFDFEYDWVPVEERLEEEDLLPVIAKYEGILCGDDRITPKVIDAAEKLEAIVKWGTGIDSIDKEYANSKGIEVRRTPGAFTEPVSDSALALMLADVRSLFSNDRVIKSGEWDKPQGYTLGEKTVGIIGFGDIGQAVARKLAPFGSTILANDIADIDEKVYQDLNAKKATKEEIFAESDIITIHTDLNESSEFMFDVNAFAQMKKKPYIINTARGPLMRESAVEKALEEGIIRGVGIDVYEFEPLGEDSIYRKSDKVVASCHNTNSSPACWDKVHLNSLQMMQEELSK